jgi:hypothetical protein
MKEVQGIDTGAKSICKIPEGKISLLHGIDDRVVLHEVLLDRVGAHITENGQFPADQKSSKDDKTAKKRDHPKEEKGFRIIAELFHKVLLRRMQSNLFTALRKHDAMHIYVSSAVNSKLWISVYHSCHLTCNLNFTMIERATFVPNTRK